MKYYISNNYNRSYKTIIAARKAIMNMYKGFQLRAVSIPVINEKNEHVGYVNEPHHYPEWRVPYWKFNPNLGREVRMEKRWVLKADGTLGERLDKKRY